jgi:hypothetical protein
MNTEFFTNHLKLKNCFYRHSKCRSAFSSFFSFCVEKAYDSQELEVMQNLATDAELALQIYSEKTWLWKRDINLIEQNRLLLNNLYENIDVLLKKQQAYEEQLQQEILYNETIIRQKDNDEVLLKVKGLQNKIETITSFEELNKHITELDNLEALLDKDNFTPKQSELYRQLSSSYTELTSEKMRLLQHQKDIEYNAYVARICKKSFDEFKENTRKYKNVDENFKAVFNEFYAIDNSRLSLETQMFYSHVYSFIFSKLSDDEKFKLVSFVLEIKQ